MYASKAARPPSSSTSPLVRAQTTTAYLRRFDALNAAASSVTSTPNPAAVPNSWIARTAAGIDSCRKPVVREKTSTDCMITGRRSVGKGQGLVGAVALEAEERGVKTGGEHESDLEREVAQRGVIAH